MDKEIFSPNELSELEALEIRGGATASTMSQGYCPNNDRGCGVGTDQGYCPNNAEGCGITFEQGNCGKN